MAKRKGAVALFEVIHRDKRFAKPNSTALSTPAWWFKGKTAGHPPHAAPGNPPAGHAPVSGEPTTLTQNENDSWPTAPSAGSGLGAMDAAPRPHIHARNSGPLTWTSGTIIAATAIAVIGLGLILTRHPRRAAADLPGNTAQPDVLNVVPDSGGSGTAPPLVRVTDDNGQPVAPAPLVRQKGLLYALIQWYPDEKTAQAASDLLNQNGVANTLEKNLRLQEVPRDDFAVVGLDGFTRSRSSKCQAYLTRIKTISKQFADKPTSFRAFRPIMFLWARGPNPPEKTAPAAAPPAP